MFFFDEAIDEYFEDWLWKINNRDNSDSENQSWAVIAADIF